MKKMKYLLNAGANINEQDNNDYNKSAIFKVIENKQLNVLKFLLANGADINIKNSSNQNILHYSIEKVYPEAVKYILLNYLNKININDKEKRGYNPILMSYTDYIFFDRKNSEQLKILNYLLKYSNFKINLKEKDNEGKNIFDNLSNINDTKILEQILNYEDFLYLNPEEIKIKRQKEIHRQLKEESMPTDIIDEFMLI